MSKTEQLNSIYKRFPEGFESGTLFTTPDQLAKSGLTRYSDDQIRYLFRQGIIPGSAQIGRQIILNEEAVQYVLDRDQKRTTGELTLPGVTPGTPSPRRGRQRLSKNPKTI